MKNFVNIFINFECKRIYKYKDINGFVISSINHSYVSFMLVEESKMIFHL
jgi:hypothetical protein